MSWRLLRWFLFLLDAETAHRITVMLIRLGIQLGGAPLRLASGATPRAPEPPSNEVFGLKFSSRVGLAAGFDKDAELLAGLPDLGFGFAEIGTVTPRPQPGNPRPRLFRDKSRLAVFNRMGFNGLGATLVSRRVAEARDGLPSGFRVGINLGKNKDTSAEKAADDYVAAARPFEGLADFLVINVSSPNTPGLRALQTVDALEPIAGGVLNLAGSWRKRPPVLLKLAPEVRGEALAEILHAGERWGIAGWVLTNTWAGAFPWEGGGVVGGWSGGPLTEASRESLTEARKLTKRPLISVGGILSAAEARVRRERGAELVQLYSGWIFRGPGFPVEVARALDS